MKTNIYKLFGALLATLLVVDYCDSANILVISFMSSKSHKTTYLRLIEGLAQRKHNITVVSPVKPFKEIPNVKEIYTMNIDDLMQSNNFNAFDSKEKEVNFDPGLILRLTTDICNKSWDLPQVKALLKEKFDLVFLQPVFNDCVLPLIYKFQVPFVMFTPIGTPSWYLRKLGGHHPSSFMPNMILGYDENMTFYQRFLNYGVDRLTEMYMSFIYEPMIEQIYREKLGEDIPSINEIVKNASLILSNSHFSLTGPKPFLPDAIDVGGIHYRPAKPLPKELDDFIQRGKDGFILFSMGSVIKGDEMPEPKRKMIRNVFSKLKQQVLWKWESETMPHLPKNVKLSKWLPQQDLLGHKDIKMFITHCGGGSTEESIYHGVPLLGIPMIGDQPVNANFAEKHGFLVKLDWNKIDEDSFLAAIEEVLNNPKYRDNVKKLSTLFKDRPIEPLEEGIFWIDYVLRHAGAPHLRSVGRNLNHFQYHSYDVIGAYLILATLIVFLTFSLLRLVCRKTCCRSRNSDKIVSNGKKQN